MTENADVEWLRREIDARSNFPDSTDAYMRIGPLRRLLAHIDQLEAEVQKCRDFFTQIPPSPDPRPTIHENAAQIMAAVTPRGSFMPKEAIPECAAYAYDLAEALYAEGRRRDGKSA